MSEYKDVVWTPGDDYDAEKLQAMADNSRLTYNNLPQMVYNAHGVARTDRLKIAAGIARLPAAPSSWWTYADVYFNGFFSPGCMPIVTATPSLTPWAWITVLVANAGGTQNTRPSNVGMRIMLTDNTGDKRPLVKDYEVSWHAIGW